MKLPELIAKLEAATEGSRELDVAIYAFDRPVPAVELEPRHQHNFDLMKAPRYTTSIDAALTLVPEGWAYQLNMLFEPNCRQEAIVWTPSNLSPVSGAHTMPLALCIAALKAREHRP